MTSVDGTVVVVGAGLAGATAVSTLREEGFGGRLVLVGGERHLPYDRPPLSKGHLTGASVPEPAWIHPTEFYADHDVELRLGVAATELDLATHTVTVGGVPLGFDRLLIATGSAVRHLPSADRSGAPVAYLRAVEDADRIRAGLASGGRVVVVGGGWIGLEVAAAARTAGCEVVVVEPAAEPLLRVLGPTVGRVFAELHRGHGVDLRTSTQVSGIDADGAVHLDDGTTIRADLVVVGIGALPNVRLAEQAGLDVGDGVLADERLRTSHPDVFVAGDAAAALHPRLRRRVRVEHWENARAQGATAARNMLGGDEVHERMPYFFSDQYDLGMEYVGHVGTTGPEDVVLRGDPGAGAFTAFWVEGGRIAAAMHANEWGATPALRAIVDASHVDLARLRDPGVPLSDVVTVAT